MTNPVAAANHGFTSSPRASLGCFPARESGVGDAADADSADGALADADLAVALPPRVRRGREWAGGRRPAGLETTLPFRGSCVRVSTGSGAVSTLSSPVLSSPVLSSPVLFTPALSRPVLSPLLSNSVTSGGASSSVLAVAKAAIIRARRAGLPACRCALCRGTRSLRWRGIKGVISSSAVIGQYRFSDGSPVTPETPVSPGNDSIQRRRSRASSRPESRLRCWRFRSLSSPAGP